MPNFRYRALTQGGEVVTGVISASSSAEVARRIDYLRLVPIDAVAEDDSARAPKVTFSFRTRARSEEITAFTRDLALLLKSGARLDGALELLASDSDIGRLRPVVSAIRSRILSGESFGDALAQHPIEFPVLYTALVRVGEASGALPHILEVLSAERGRAEVLQRKVADALRYPTIVLFGASGVLIFFLMFVLPQFASLLRDFNAKIDPFAEVFLSLSEVVNAHKELIAGLGLLLLSGGFLAARAPACRKAALSSFGRLPVIHNIFGFHRTALFCRNLGVLLGAGVPLTTTLRVLADMMLAAGDAAAWTGIVEHVRHGGRLSDALERAGNLPAMALRMLRLGEETSQLPALAGRAADFYEVKLGRTLDRAIALVGPLAIIVIGVIVGGLIVSVMNSLLSITQLVG